MMKIMFISPHPGFGGASTANQAIAYMLSKEGNEVIYVDEYCKSFLYDTFSCSRFPIHKNRFTKHFNTYKYILRESPDYILIGIPYIGIYYLAFLLYLRYVKK